jgi:hypothetical protein
MLHIMSVLGIGDLTKINIPAGDAGGELDPHGADGNGKARLWFTRPCAWLNWIDWHQATLLAALYSPMHSQGSSSSCTSGLYVALALLHPVVVAI